VNDIIRKCVECKKYTLEEKCSCGGKTLDAHPPKFSLEKEKKFGKYRRQAKV